MDHIVLMVRAHHFYSMKLDQKHVNLSQKEWVGKYAKVSHVTDLLGGSGRGGGEVSFPDDFSLSAE